MAATNLLKVPGPRSLYEANLNRHLQVFAELPAAFWELSREEILARTAAAKEALGDSTLILGHNYQADDVVRWADHTGDSYQLSVKARESTAENIVFCGVTFMAETADILTDGGRNVLIPSMEASCPMAGMAEMVQVDRAWRAITSVIPEGEIVPVTYINSYADLKAFTAAKGGLVCTSANVHEAFRWALDQGKRILALPDKNLAMNTARDLGIPDDEVVGFNPWKAGGGVTEDVLRNARVVVWEGYCQVHDRFKVEHIDALREQYPDIKVIVHPECRPEVVRAADADASTSGIIRFVEAQPPGTRIAIGTEIHLVQRLAKEHPDKHIVQVCGEACLDCNAMRQVDPRYLLWVLEELVEGRVLNRIELPEDERDLAKVSLERMLEL